MSLFQAELCHRHRHRCAESGEAIEDGSTHLKLGDLAVEITRHHSLAEQLETAHFGFLQTASIRKVQRLFLCRCPRVYFGVAKKHHLSHHNACPPPPP